MTPSGGIDLEMRCILGEMEVFLSYAPTVNWEPATSSGERTYGCPPGSSWSAHEFWRYKYENAISHQRVLEMALLDDVNKLRLEE